MKTIGYRFLAAVYNLCRIICSIRKDKVVFWNGHSSGLNGNFLELYRRMKENPDYRFVILSKQELFRGDGSGVFSVFRKMRGGFVFFFVLPFHMATAKRVLFNDNFLPLGYMRTEMSGTQFIQLWHGAGAFKRFGLSTEGREDVRRAVGRANQKITHLFITSEQVRPFYEEAFAISREKIFITGIPATDLYFDEARKCGRITDFFDRYPALRGKKLLLYAPTFRSSDEENQKLLEWFDVNRVHEILGEDWVILVKMHPRFPVGHVKESDFCVDLTEYSDISDLYLVTDLFVTDYSSSVVEYALLDKPLLLYAYDLKRYDRGFYFPYEEMAPGRIARRQEELEQMLAEYTGHDGGKTGEAAGNGKGDDPVGEERRRRFIAFEFGGLRGGACDRILKILGKDE